jgi:hypothetical protein
VIGNMQMLAINDDFFCIGQALERSWKFALDAKNKVPCKTYVRAPSLLFSPRRVFRPHAARRSSMQL